MNQTQKAKRFAKLHAKGSPLLLYNAWDAGSVKRVVIPSRITSSRPAQIGTAAIAELAPMTN